MYLLFINKMGEMTRTIKDLRERHLFKTTGYSFG